MIFLYLAQCLGYLQSNGNCDNVFQIIYGLNDHYCYGDKEKAFVLATSGLSILLNQTSLICNKSFEPDDAKDIIENENFIFIGSLLVKLFKIKSINAFQAKMDEFYTLTNYNDVIFFYSLIVLIRITRRVFNTLQIFLL